MEGVFVFLFFFELFMYFARCVLLLAVVVNWLLTVYGNCGVSVPRCDSNFTSSANIRSQSHIVMASLKVSFFVLFFPPFFLRDIYKNKRTHTLRRALLPRQESGEEEGTLAPRRLSGDLTCLGSSVACRGGVADLEEI